MKEYKGVSGLVRLDGENIFIKNLLLKEECTLSDINTLKFSRPSALAGGLLTIITLKNKYEIVYKKAHLSEFEELYSILNESVVQGELCLQEYSVLYLGGLPENPKKTYNIILTLSKNEFYLKSKFGEEKFASITIPYTNVKSFDIVDRQVSTVEGLLGGVNSRQLNQPNNIHITFVAEDNKEFVVRLEMITGTTVMGQAAKCAALLDYMKVNGIFDNFIQENSAGAAASSGEDILAQIEKLSTLHQQSILTDEEFDTKKAELLKRL